MWDPQGPGVPTLEPAGWSGSEVQPRGAGVWAPPTPGGDRLTFRLAEAGWGKGVPHHSRVISSSNQPNKGVGGSLS